MRTIGLIGGMSWQSSAEYYRIINQAVQTRLGPLRSAQILMYSLDFGSIERAQHEGRWDDAGALMARAAIKLQAGGADCVVLCTNTMHKLIKTIERAVTIPILHIANPVGQEARAHHLTRVALLGTRFTMEQDFLRYPLQQGFGLDVMIPDRDDREQIHRIIYEELCVGVVTEPSRAVYRQVIKRQAARGAQAIILGCTEISLLIDATDSDLPLLDTTRLHALAAVEFSLESLD